MRAVEGRVAALARAQTLAMAVHELATNAVKYGALSVRCGRVSIVWQLDGGPAGVLRLRWAETGGPAVAGPPERRGVGTRVLDGTMRAQLGGAVTLAWEAAGLVCGLEVPLGAREAGPPGALDNSIAAME
jgi:two-component sensor histidine kinase